MNKHRTIVQQKKPLMSIFLIVALLYLIMCPFAHSLTLSSNATALLPQKHIVKSISPQKESLDSPSATTLVPQECFLFKKQSIISISPIHYYKPSFSLTLISTSRLIL
jgi:hypothetical protein